MAEDFVVKYIRRKNKIRKIVTYQESSELRKYHEAVVDFLRKNVYDSIFAKAYVPGASIYKNAEAHLYNDIYVKVDIKQFFPSINLKIMEEQLYKEISKVGEISRFECHEIVTRCSVGQKGLPLGLVSSPALANIYLKEFDGILYGKMKKLKLENLIYTRYADDMVISFRIKEGEEYRQSVAEMLRMITRLLGKYKLKINENKTQIINLYRSNHVRITGVSVVRQENNYRHISVGRKTKNEIFWEAIKLYDAEQIDYKELSHLKGLLSFVLSIEKKGIENVYSEKMMSMLKERGADSVKELLKKAEQRQ
ncbi:MAG: reverse transcriptase family protein [Candidatus Gastranaerophilales bacterium]|nr:reverse transcriptase family protein [Candidatus Gastranaerophilales bacterium]